MLSDRRKLFNDIAGRYRLLNHLMSAGRHIAWRKKTVRKLSPTPDLVLLDLCGGTGEYTELFRNRIGTPLRNTVLVDLSEEMLREGRGRTARRSLQGDAQHLPLRDNTFDLVVCGFGVRNLPDPEAGLREIGRVLRPGGRVAILEFFRPDTLFTRFFYNILGGGVIGFLGRAFGRKEEYRYLLESLRGFVTADRFGEMMGEAGFREVEIAPLDFGIVHAVYAVYRGKEGE